MSCAQLLFSQLDSWLAKHAMYWNFQPFHCDAYPWQQNSALTAWLDGLTPMELEAYQHDYMALHTACSTLIEQLALPDALQIPEWSMQLSVLESRINTAIPGRKWQQIKQFIGCLGVDSPTRLLDWCGGKGYLARSFAYLSPKRKRLDCLEWQNALCEQGTQFAATHQLALHFHCVDVLAADSCGLVNSDTHCVALHACGDLHSHLLKVATRQGSQRISFAPCCYHLTQHETYQVLSNYAQTARIQLSKAALSLPLQELVTAGTRKRRLRAQELLWRLAFDEYQRDVTQSKQYMPVGRIAESQLSQSFAQFCEKMALCKCLAIPSVSQCANYLQQGQRRTLQVQRMELIQTLFKRSIEMWLLLDKIIFLQEQGYQVQWGTFCTKQITPRNLLVDAILQK